MSVKYLKLNESNFVFFFFLKGEHFYFKAICFSFFNLLFINMLKIMGCFIPS